MIGDNIKEYDKQLVMVSLMLTPIERGSQKGRKEEKDANSLKIRTGVSLFLFSVCDVSPTRRQGIRSLSLTLPLSHLKTRMYVSCSKICLVLFCSSVSACVSPSLFFFLRFLSLKHKTRSFKFSSSSSTDDLRDLGLGAWDLRLGT